MSKAHDFSHDYIDGANFDGHDLTGASFNKANLFGGTNFLRANLYKATFRDAVLANVSFRYANLKDVDFTNANLSDVSFNFATIENCKGIKLLFRDPDRYENYGYQLVRWTYIYNPIYNCGCHTFTKSEALAHWGGKHYPNPRIGMHYCAMIRADTIFE